LRVGVLEKTEHNPVDGLDEIITSVLYVPRAEFFHDFGLVLVLVDQLSQGKASSET
jgi:hypothetical protein